MRILTKEERAKIEKLIDAGLKPSLIAEITGRSRSVINKLANGTYDALKEKERKRQQERQAEKLKAEKIMPKYETAVNPPMTLSEQLLASINKKLERLLAVLEVK